MIVVLLGPPGAGKGTQAAVLARELDMAHVSTGDLFREHLRLDTPLGRSAREFMERGELVPDRLVVEMVQECLSAERGVVLDGFPRTVAQAEALQAILWPVRPIVVALEVPDSVLLPRLAGRRVCEAAGHVFNLATAPPASDEVCDFDGSRLVQRPDDHEDKARHRLLVYARETAPVLEYYDGQRLLRTVDGAGTVVEVAGRLAAAVAGAGNASAHGAPAVVDQIDRAG